MEYFYRGFRFTKDKGQLDPRAVQRLLEQTYWANDRSLSVFRRVQPGESAGGLCANAH